MSVEGSENSFTIRLEIPGSAMRLNKERKRDVTKCKLYVNRREASELLTVFLQ